MKALLERIMNDAHGDLDTAIFALQDGAYLGAIGVSQLEAEMLYDLLINAEVDHDWGNGTTQYTTSDYFIYVCGPLITVEDRI